MTEVWLKDRLNDSRRQVGDNESLLEGRWILEQPVYQSSHTEIIGGDLLLDDGALRQTLGAVNIEFRRARLSDVERGVYQLALDAIAAIDAKTDLTTEKWPSPLLPADLGQQSELKQLDALLHEVLERGHLDTIARRPRLSMRYDTELLPVDRARRLETGFQRHLAAHSEHWAARTLSGVVPKLVLARVSNDDALIYEHRVYARLLDHLERYLRARIGKLAAITERYEAGLEFSNSQDVDWRLRKDICAVWGEAVTSDKADELIRQNRQQLINFERWLKHIRSLKGQRINGLDGGSLYQLIPQGAQVGLNLVATNLLQHDPHYRQLRRLWSAWLTATTADRERPVGVLARRFADEDRYERYIGLLLFRVIYALGFQIQWKADGSAVACHALWGDEIKVQNRNHAWSIDRQGHRLVLVPSAAPLDGEILTQWTTNGLDEDRELRVPCILHGSDKLSPPEHLLHEQPAFYLSPLDLYAEERATTLVVAWLWKQRIAGYGEKFTRLPTPVIDAWPETDSSHSNQYALLQPLESTQWNRLHDALNQYANIELRDRVITRKTQLDRLACCPECEVTAKIFAPNKQQGFFAQCVKCYCRWELRDGQFNLGMQTSHQKREDFQIFGHRCLSVKISGD